jgi:hypothetical protein
MTGLSNYTANNELNWLTGQAAQPALPAVYLGLFTAVGVDAGTGFTEVSGGSYARVQVAGSATTNNTTSTSSAVLHFASTPSWIVAGMTVYDTTAPTAIAAATTVLSTTGTTVTMSANAAGSGVGNGDTIVFSAFSAPTGSAPGTDTNGAVITFAQATANWGTVIAWGLYDASSTGNLLLWDFLGNYNWIPVFMTSVGSGNGGVLSAHAHGYSNGDPIVVTAEYGGALPTVTQGTLSSYTVNYVANQTTDTYTLSSSSTSPSSGNAVWTSTSSSMMARKLTQQIIPQNVTASFAASAFNLLAA